MPTIQDIIKKISGYYDYNDLATQTTPLSITGNGSYQKLTNDGLGSFSVQDQRPTGMSDVWNTSLNQLDFSELNFGDKIAIRLDLSIETLSNSAEVKMRIHYGIGSGFEFSHNVINNIYKNQDTYDVSVTHGFHISTATIRDYPAEIQIASDVGLNVVINGWYIDINKRSTTIKS